MAYISITDFTKPKQVRAMRKVLSGTGSTRDLGVGVMMSRKTLLGLPTKWSTAFPKNEDIASIFLSEPGLFNVLHYADYDGQTTADNLVQAMRFAGPNVQGLQLDMPWPKVFYLHQLRLRYSDLKFIIQVSAIALDQVHDGSCDTIPRLEARLRHYRAMGCLDYVLLDFSMGRGEPMDAARFRRYIEKLQPRLPDVEFVVAGGLGPDSLHLLDPLLPSCANVSIDAQSRLRPSGNALDPIDWKMAAKYLRSAATKFKCHEAILA